MSRSTRSKSDNMIIKNFTDISPLIKEEDPAKVVGGGKGITTEILQTIPVTLSDVKILFTYKIVNQTNGSMETIENANSLPNGIIFHQIKCKKYWQVFLRKNCLCKCQNQGDHHLFTM